MYKTLNAQNMKKKPWNESSAENPITWKVCRQIKPSENKARISGPARFYLGRFPLLASKMYFRAWLRTLSYYEEGTQKYSNSTLKNPKTELFLVITRQK